MRIRWLLLAPALLVFLPAGADSPPRSPAEETLVTLMHRAAEQRRQGDYTAASETYRQVLRRAPQLYEAHLFLADTLRKRRLDTGAEEEFLAARRIRPDEPFSYVSLADMKRERFRFGEALAVLEEGWREVPPERREALVAARGTVLRQAGEEEKSVEILRQGMRDFPGSFRIPEALARSLEALGRLNEAVEMWDLATRRAPENASIALDGKEARDLAGRLEQAEKAARVPGAGPEAWERLARLRILARQFPQAAEAAASCLRQAPRRAGMMLLRGLALEKAGRLEEAESQLKRIGSEAPEHLLALYHRAYLARLRKDAGAEDRIWREAIEKHPHDPSAFLMLVLGWKRSGSLEARAASLRAEAGRREGRASSRILEGMALEEAGRDVEAERIYEQLYLAEPRDPESAARLSGLVALRPALLGRLLEDESSRHTREGKAEGPGRHLLLALLLQAAGREKEAVEEMREAAEIFPEREEVQLGLAAALQISGGDRAAISRALDRALALAPGSAWAHLEKGLVLLRDGDFAGAVREGETVKGLAPELPEGRQLLGAALRSAGDYAGAVKELGESLLLDPGDSPGVVRFQRSLALAALGERRAAQAELEGDAPPFPEWIHRLAWIFVRRTFLDRTFRGQDWLVWRDRLPDPGASPAEACAAVAEMLASLRDPYTRVRGVEETASLYLRPRSGKLETDASGSPTQASASVLTGDLGENLGYIRLTSLSDPSAREAIRRALDRLAEREGLVLDLRGNPGGLASDADAIAGLLLDPGEETGRERTRFGQQVQTAPGNRRPVPRRPLVILTDRRTGSAAEKLAAGLQGAGRATVIGDETFGKGAGQMSRLLPGGEMVLVTALENLTREGRPLQGRGVVPDVPGSEDDSLEKAKEILRTPTP